MGLLGLGFRAIGWCAVQVFQVCGQGVVLRVWGLGIRVESSDSLRLALSMLDHGSDAA